MDKLRRDGYYVRKFSSPGKASFKYYRVLGRDWLINVENCYRYWRCPF
ncbi:hypothetical protein HMPREF0322_04190 [Desulfitobacterium hafniense DP7]|uniref:Uncharacterized protein n=1 Tax=Desulfitobacterium hafniense DP7 TaxID=537010 RepID=G9XT84_DESHA|nr:hypothetical protein HMPREF0322_04190 [Desulfitobacterium hafniense DP7]